MTWEQIQLFAEKAGERLAQERISSIDSQAGAIGIALTGDIEPLKEMAREAGVTYDSRSRPSSASPQLTDGLRELAAAGNVRISSSGANRRGAKRRARGQDKRVPRVVKRG